DYSLGSTTAHEIGHSFGYPDLYHYTFDGFEPVGKWDMQSENRGHHGAYMKYIYGGWVSNLPMLSKPGVYTLNPLNSRTEEKVGYMIPSPNSPTEFFVVEYRKPDPLIENHFEDDGLLLYRINPTSTGNDDGGWGDFKDEIYIFRQGGSLVRNGDINLAQQPASGISDISRNRLFLSDAKDGGISISEIKKENGQLSFKLDFTSKPYMNVTQKAKIIAAAGGREVWPVMSNTAGWKAKSSEKWITASVDAMSGEIRLDVESNTGSPRLATIQVEAEGVPVTNYYLAQKSPDPEVELLFLVDKDPIIPIGNYAGAKRSLHVIGENYSANVLDASGKTHSQIFSAVEVDKSSFLFIRDAIEPATKVEGKLVLTTNGKNPIRIERPVEVLSQHLSFSKNSVQFLATDKRTQEVEIESSSVYELDGTIPGWLTVQKSNDQRSLTFKAEDNLSPNTRIAQFCVHAGLLSKPIVISQRSLIPDFYFLKCPPIRSGEGTSTVWEYKTNADNIKFKYAWGKEDLSFVHDPTSRTLTFTPDKPASVGVDLKISLNDHSFIKHIGSEDNSDLYQESSMNSLPPEKNNSTFMTVSDRFLTDHPDLHVPGLKIEPVNEPNANVYCLTTTETNYSLFPRKYAAPITISQDPTILLKELSYMTIPTDPYSTKPVDYSFKNFYMIDKLTCDQPWVEWDMKEDGFSVRRIGYNGALSRNAIITLHAGAYTYPVQYTEEGSSTDPYLYLPLSEVTASSDFQDMQVPVSTSKYADLTCTLSGETQGISVEVEPDEYDEEWHYMGHVWIVQDTLISKNKEQTFTLHMQIGNQKRDFTVHTKKEMSGQYDPLPNENIQTDTQSSVNLFLSDGIVRIDSPYSITDVTVYGASGQTLARQGKGKENDSVDISALPVGVYFVKVRTEQGTTVQKIVKPL
ncbi:MAG: T9SS type A sorting domain-containing protein, partial [Tannerellaceae bacterium]